MSTATVSTGLTGPQLQALSALLAGGTAAEAAEAGRVSPRTVRDWLQQPEFRAEFLHGQQQLFHQISMQLAGAAARALHTLIEISEDPEQKGSVRVAAANKVMHLFLHHGPRVSALLAPPPAPEKPAAPDPGAQLLASMKEALDRVYGTDDEEDEPTPVQAPVPPAAAVPSPPSAPLAFAGPAAPLPDSDPQGAPPAPGFPPTALDSQRPTRLTLAGRNPSETPAPFIEPGSEFVSWRR